MFDPYLDRVASVDERGTERHYTFDSRGNAVKEFDGRTGGAARGNQTRFEHDNLGRELAAHYTLTSDGTGAGDVIGIITGRQVWDSGNHAVTQIDPNGNETRMTYNGQGRVTRVDYADGTFETMRYDASGNLIEHVDENGTRLDMTYDLLDRLSTVQVDPGPGVDSSTTFERFMYDGSSNMVLAVDDDTEVKRRYDSIGSIIFEIQEGRRTEVEVDGYGRTTKLTYPSGRVIEYVRDGAGRVQEIRDNKVIAEFDYRGPVWVAGRRYPLRALGAADAGELRRGL